MGLTVILASLHAFPSHQFRHQDSRDVEKGPPPEDRSQEQGTSRDGEGDNAVEDGEGDNVVEDGYGTDEEDDDTDTPETPEPHSDPRPTRFRRFPTITSISGLSKPFTRSSTLDTSISTTASIYSRVKTFIFPPEDPDALEQFVPNYRYTPIISGIVIPFSILLEIPGLTEHWYIRTEANSIVETQPNPPILDVGLGISMACALIANICLILRFLEKRVKTMTLFCIIFLTLHDLINIITVMIFGIEHRFNDGFTYGQAYWMTVCSTVASSVTNISLIVDYCRTPDFATSGSGLTRKQRSLVVIVMTLLVYVAFGALCNSLIQDLSFIDGLYFTTVTIETIGFGDITPRTAGARVFTCCYMVFGIINVGLVVGMCRETVLEALEVGYRRRIQKMRVRRREARRFRMWETRWRRAIEWRLKERGLPVWVHDRHMPHEGIRFVGLPGPQDGAGEAHWFKNLLETSGWKNPKEEDHPHVRGHPRGKHLNIDALSSQQLESAALEAGVPLEMFTAPRHGHLTAEAQASGSRGPTDRSFSHLTFGSGLHRTSSANGWPSHPQTPTHAQIGRMAAMITKFAVAASGTHVRMLGHVSEDVEAHERRLDERVEDTSQPKKKRGNTVWFGEGGAARDADGSDALQGTTCESPIEFRTEGDDGGEGQHHDHQTGSGVTPLVETQAQAPKWARELARGVDQRSAVSYENYKKEMESEERKAYLAKLTIAWSLFLIFWTIGSAIFSATEGWAYGSAMYFCFMAFTTTGYGDYHPTTPAGRSVFVVWALLGVATMTILISVLQEAGSSRYKKALHSRMFDNAVKKYRHKGGEEANRLTQERIYSVSQARMAANLSQLSHTSSPANGMDPAIVDAARETAQQELEELPSEILRQARTIHEHMQFYVKHGQLGYEQSVMPGEERKTRVPRELKSLLNEIAGLEGIGEGAKREILQDEEARKTLFMLSIERTIRGMINAAERSLAALAERDNLEALQRHRKTSHPAVGDEPDSDIADAEEDSGQVSDVEFDETPDVPDNIRIRPPPSPSMESSRRLKGSPLRNLVV